MSGKHHLAQVILKSSLAIPINGRRWNTQGPQVAMVPTTVLYTVTLICLFHYDVYTIVKKENIKIDYGKVNIKN